MSAASLITSTLDYAALVCALPPFALVKGEVRRTEGHVVLMRFALSPPPRLIVRLGDVFEESLEAWIADARKVETRLLHATGRIDVLSHSSAEALFADVCADLCRGGASMRQWSEELPFQIVLARARLRDITPHTFDVVPVLYASGPRWIPTKERPVDETP